MENKLALRSRNAKLICYHERLGATGFGRCPLARALGFQVWVDYAGIALVAQNLSQKALTADSLTLLARAAYELGEER